MFSGYCAGLGVTDWVLMIGLWGAFLAVVVWAVTRMFPSATRRDDAEGRLDRPAAGDLDADAYHQMRDQADSKGSR